MAIQAKYIDVRNYVRDMIRELGPGGRLPSEAELCANFGVSRVTVRRALEQIETEGLIFRKKGHGTFVRNARPTTDASSFLLVSSFTPSRASYLSKILAGCLSRASETGTLLHVISERDPKTDVIALAHHLNAHGVIGLAPYSQQYEILEELRMTGFPVLIVNRVLTNSNLSYVSTDHREGIRTATQRLLDKGHTRIAYAADIPSLSFAEQRYQGYADAFRNHGATVSDELVVHIHEEQIAAIEETILAQLEDVLTNRKPTALVLAAGVRDQWHAVLQWIRRMGLRIPQDLEVIAFDEIAENAPEKRAVHEIVQPLFRLGETAVECICGIAGGKAQQTRILLPAELRMKSTD